MEDRALLEAANPAPAIAAQGTAHHGAASILLNETMALWALVKGHV